MSAVGLIHQDPFFERKNGFCDDALLFFQNNVFFRYFMNFVLNIK